MLKLAWWQYKSKITNLILLNMILIMALPQYSNASIQTQCLNLYSNKSALKSQSSEKVFTNNSNQENASLQHLEYSTYSTSKTNSLKEKFQIKSAKIFNDLIVNLNLFWVVRGLNAYKSAFGELFEIAVSALTNNNHWIDVGAGSARAQFDYLLQSKNQNVHTTAIAVSRPLSYWALKARAISKNSNILKNNTYVSGKKIESLDIQDIKPADLITDMFGAFSYAAHIDQVLFKEISMLKVGGKLFIYSPIIFQIEIFDVNGSKIPFYQWLSQIEGIKFSSLHKEFSHVQSDFLTADGFVIERTDEKINIPSLQLIDMKMEIVPERKYLWKF